MRILSSLAAFSHRAVTGAAIFAGKSDLSATGYKRLLRQLHSTPSNLKRLKLSPNYQRSGKRRISRDIDRCVLLNRAGN
jgi:peptide subunit release factor 1 (eRF1)